jgi:hypothetical protein
MWIFRAHIPVNQEWLQAVCGLLFGVSIGINLFGLRLASRCDARESAER